jgi:hypothetical protein
MRRSSSSNCCAYAIPSCREYEMNTSNPKIRWVTARVRNIRIRSTVTGNLVHTFLYKERNFITRCEGQRLKSSLVYLVALPQLPRDSPRLRVTCSANASATASQSGPIDTTVMWQALILRLISSIKSSPRNLVYNDEDLILAKVRDRESVAKSQMPNFTALDPIALGSRAIAALGFHSGFAGYVFLVP